MSNQTIYIVMGVTVAAFVLIVIAYLILRKRMQKSEYKEIQKLQRGTKQKKFSLEIMYQRLYVTYVRIPFLKRYILKLRKRLEIINIDDEYNTRKDASKILTKALAVLIPIVVISILITVSNYLVMFIVLIFEFSIFLY